MGIVFSADEVLKMAINIEQNGANFYRKAAGSQKDPAVKEQLIKLAEMEDDHGRTFTKIAEGLDESVRTSVFDENEVDIYIKAMVDALEVEGAPTIADALMGDESFKEILEMAIDLEKESILFYVGMKMKVPERLGKNNIEEIIQEEVSHAATLQNMLLEME